MATFNQPGRKSDPGGLRRSKQQDQRNITALQNQRFWNRPAKERHTSHDLKRVQRYLRGGVIGCPLYRGVEHSVHHRDFGVIEDETCGPETDSLRWCEGLGIRRSHRSAPLLAPPAVTTPTFGLAQQGRDAVAIRLRLSQLHQGQKEVFQGVVEGLQEGEAQAEALHRLVCGPTHTSGHHGGGRFYPPAEREAAS